jgi:solute carrier family 8 (sodium/calcium exchanger)
VLTPTINENNIVDHVCFSEGVLHLLSLPWKVLFSFIIPPKHWLSGYLTVLMSLAVVGVLTFLITDLSKVLECTLNLRTSVTAVTILSIGFSLPELFASAAAAKHEISADSAIGHVMGTNAISFFVGIGLPWVIQAIYARKTSNIAYQSYQPEVVWSLIILVGVSVIGLIVLGIRRCACKGELGGSVCGRVWTLIVMITLWIAFVTLVIVNEYLQFASFVYVAKDSGLA